MSRKACCSKKKAKEPEESQEFDCDGQPKQPKTIRMARECYDSPKKTVKKSECPENPFQQRLKKPGGTCDDKKKGKKGSICSSEVKPGNECDGAPKRTLKDTPSQMNNYCRSKVKKSEKEKRIQLGTPCSPKKKEKNKKDECQGQGKTITRENIEDMGIDCDQQIKRAEFCREEPLIYEQPVVDEKCSDQSDRVPYPSVFKTFKEEQEPLHQHLKESYYQEKYEALLAASVKTPKERDIEPPLPVRIGLYTRPEPTFPREPFIVKKTRKQRKAYEERRKKQEQLLNFCKFDVVDIQKPPKSSTLDPIELPSPEASKADVKVVPRAPSISISHGIPPTPTQSKLELIKPKSGIYINVKEPPKHRDDTDSFDLLYHGKPRPKREPSEPRFPVPEPIIHKVKPPRKGKTAVQIQALKDEEAKKAKQALLDAIQEETDMLEEDGEGKPSDTGLMEMIRQQVERVSVSTSLNSKELAGFFAYDEEDLEGQPFMHKIVQKFRRDSEIEKYRPPQRVIKRGTLESHSFTKLKQETLKDFYFGLMLGTINQNDEQFSDASRGCQGICIPVAAYCFAMVLHPTKWTELIVDNVIDAGDKLYFQSLGILHNHEYRKELGYRELDKYCTIGSYKIYFEIYEPEIIGQIRSTDKKVFTLSKGLQLFFQRHRAAIFTTQGLCLAIWRDKHYYVFDGVGRRKDFVKMENGKALMASFYDIQAIATVLLDYANLGNWPYTLSKISVIKIGDQCDVEQTEPESSVFKEHSEFNILNENKAVLHASFDLADLCFDFTRNKQAIAIAMVCLVYSKITPPNAWHKNTLNKIMIIGNQIYLELVEAEHVIEMTLEDLPSSFTVGPYVIEILIYSKVSADVMYRRNACVLKRALDKFFKSANMAIVYIGKNVLAIWKQRGMYYCFDPYSRNNEGLRCRNGSACLTMNSTIEAMIAIISSNFENKDDVFYIHSLKVVKIHRDPAKEHLFPKTIMMDQFPCEAFKQCKVLKKDRKAVIKAVTAKFADCAVKRLMPWNFLEESIIDVASRVESITKDQMPPMVHKFASRAILRAALPEVERPIDLDSPSLSDTQIEPFKPEPMKGDEGIDLDNWELTQEEIELQARGEGEEGGEGGGETIEQIKDTYLAMNQASQVHDDSLDSYHKNISAEVNTDITFCFLPFPRDVLPPTDMRYKQKLMKDKQMRSREVDKIAEITSLPPVTQSMELTKESNFIDLPDDTQLVRGTTNIANHGEEVEYMAPFICIMAAAVKEKYALISWSSDIIDYTLSSGAELYKLSKVRFDQVPILEVPKVSLGQKDYNILSEYLFDASLEQSVLESTLEKVLFKKSPCGVIVTPSYACTVFVKNNLFYLFDCFGCNQVGLGFGPSNRGAACLSRFKSAREMAGRIMYNKKKRDSAEEYDFSRFIMSAVTVREIHHPKQEGRLKSFDAGEDEGGGEDDDDEVAAKAPQEPQNLVGYQLHEGFWTIQGTTALTDRASANVNGLKEDHFVCLCAALMLLCYPVYKWDTQRVDYVLAQGANVFSHADDLKVAEKRYIRNVLMYKNYFDVIIKKIQVADWEKNKNLGIGLDTMLLKRDYVIIQFPNQSYLFYRSNDEYHIFDPYASKPNGTQDEDEGGHAGWTRFTTLKAAKKRLKKQIAPDCESYTFYMFEVASVRRANKTAILNQTLMEYDLTKPIKPEPVGRPFNEKDCWLRAEPLPWTRMNSITASGDPRGDRDLMWHNWDVEYKNDLFSLAGTFHQTSSQFDEPNRGKQTLANLVVAIGMTEIYEFTEWNSSVLDSILINGNQYYEECIEKIEDEDYELAFEDLKKSFTIFPYKLKMSYIPFVDGTIFIMRSNQFNLYKAMRYFFDIYPKHNGVIISIKGESTQKRMIAFGKLREKEFFMYDCQANGPPMFIDSGGTSYILRCRTLKRLVHVMTLTLRGGDFFVYEVNTGGLKAVK